MNPSELSTDPSARVVMLCPFPPPMVGAAKNSVLVREALQARGLEIITLTTSVTLGSAHARSIRYHLRRSFRFLSNCLTIARLCTSRADTFYIVPDGGWGVWYTFLYTCIIVALTRGSVFLHHRNFLNMTRRHPAMAAMNALLRQRGNHVFLEEEMRRLFINNYGAIPSAFIVRNAATCDVRSTNQVKTGGPIAIGFLSNLNVDKGFDVVVDAFLQAGQVNRDLEFHVAGKPTDKDAEALLSRLQSELGPRLKYFGAVHGQQKEDFFSSIDIFVFPSRYKLEAQPNVLYEASSRGATIISTSHACIPFMLDDIPKRLISTDDENFNQRFGEAILEEANRLSEPETRRTRKDTIILRFDLINSTPDTEYERLITEIAQSTAGLPPSSSNTFAATSQR